MIHATPSERAAVDGGRTSSMPATLGLSLVVAHVALLACFGQAYAKLRMPIDELPIYVTEVVVVLAALTSTAAIGRVPLDAITKLVLGFVAVGVAWVVIAGVGDPAGAGAKALSFFAYVALYFIVRGNASTDAQRWRLLRALMVASVIAAGLALWRTQTGLPVEETTTGSGRWIGGEFALYAVIAAMIAGIEAIARRRLTTGGAVVLIAAGVELVFAQHRSGFVALGVALVVTVVLVMGSSRALKGLLGLVATAAAALVVARVVLGVGLDDTLLRIASITDASDANIDWRLLAWYEVLDGVASRPLGHGFATWDFLFTMADPLTGSHNAFLDLAYRVGVVGLALWLGTVGVLIARARVMVRASALAPHLTLVAACGGLIAFLVFAAFNVVLATPHMSVLFWVLLGIGSSALGPAPRAAPRSAARSPAAPASS